MAEVKNENENICAIDIQREYESYDRSEYESKLERKCIYRWPNDLIMTSSLSKHQTPHMASFGPYHHGEEHLRPMEHHKERALYRILEKSNVSTSALIESLKGVEQELMDCYDNLDKKLTSDSFLRMMLLDGCFMLELIRARLLKEPKDPDPVFNRRGAVMNTVILRDMMILENQIPLLVLRKLHGIEDNREINDDTYLEDLFHKVFGFEDTSPVNKPNLHILDVYRKCLIMESAPMQQETLSSEVSMGPVRTRRQSGLHVAGEKLKSMLTSIPTLDFRALCCRPIPRSNVRSAMRFHEAGVEFRKQESNTGLKVTFDKENGVLTLPFILVHNHTAAIYVNIMAFERMHSKLWGDQKMISYVGFMDSLVDTAEDVNLLCSRGIMRNMLGSDEEAAQLFNSLGVGIPYCPDYKVYLALQEYAASFWNAARAYLKRKYFKNPWAAVSVLAGIFLLVLTLIQTLFSVLAFIYR